MSDRRDFFFRQLVTEAELDEAYDDLESADRAIMADLGLFGIATNGVVSEEGTTPDLSVDISGPGVAYDQAGQRIPWTGAVQNLSVSVDELAASTAVTTPSNDKYLSIFVAFDRVLSDSRTDGSGATILYDRIEGHDFNVVQGAQAASGSAVRPSLRSDEVLLADVLITFGTTQVFNADIDTSRRQILDLGAEASVDATVRDRFEFVNTTEFLPAGVTNLDASIPFTFTAQSPTAGRLTLTGASLAASAWNHLLEYGMLVEVLTGGGTSVGFYVLTGHVAASTYIEVRTLVHALPTFPTSGSGTLKFHTVNRIAASDQTLVGGVEPMPTNARTQATMSNVFVGGHEDDSTALTIMSAGNPLGSEDRALLSVLKGNDPGVSERPLEIFAIMPQGVSGLGFWEAYQGLIHTNMFLRSSAEILYGVPGAAALRARSTLIPLESGQPETDGSGAALWDWQSTAGIQRWEPVGTATAPTITFPVVLPRGAVLTNIQILLKPNSARSPGEWTANLYRVDYNFGTPAVPTYNLILLTGPLNYVLDDTTANYQTMVVLPNSTLTLSDTDESAYHVMITGPSVPLGGDHLLGIRANWTDPGPRNY